MAYVYVRMGNSPRPGLWVLEKSKDYGKTWSPWQYFSDSASDCLTYFGVDSHKPIIRDDSVICTTEYSKVVPLEGGEIPISILNNRPSAKHYFNSTLLQEWTRATNVRFRFLRTKNLLGHLMSVVRQDPTVTRRVSDIEMLFSISLDDVFFNSITNNLYSCLLKQFLFSGAKETLVNILELYNDIPYYRIFL